MSYKLFLMSGSSNSGKTVLANGLLNIASKKYNRVQFYKALSIDNNSCLTQDSTIVASYLQEYAKNSKNFLQAINNTVYFDPENEILYCHGQPLTQSKLITRDNIDCDNLKIQDIENIKNQIRSDLKNLCEYSDLLIAEGGGNCLLGGEQEFSNRWPAHEFNFPIVLVAEGRDGGGFLSLLSLRNEMNSQLQKQVVGFVVNGVLEKNQTIENLIDQISIKTGWPCLGILPWFQFDEKSSYEQWQANLEVQLHKHAQPLLKLILNP